uniref:Uncharacterized protein n=1 Tax=viral metagenome TaxID=1070528 RepID=A0A6C0F091_9ZZZZ
MSNMQTGTRGLSAGDYTRLKRIRGAKTYVTANLTTDQDIDSSTRVGIGRIRRPASMWSDYKASQTADFVTSASTGLNGNTLSLTKLCDCSTTSPTVKTTGCSKCGVFTHKTIQ